MTHLTRFSHVSWMQIKAHLDQGEVGVWIDCGLMWVIVCEGPLVLTSLLKVDEFDRVAGHHLVRYNRAESTEFEKCYQPHLQCISLEDCQCP